MLILITNQHLLLNPSLTGELLLFFSNVFIECEFSGVAGSQQEFGWCTGDFGKSAHPASVPGGGPAHQSDGSKS